MEFQFDGFLALRKGDVIKVTWAYPPPSDNGPRRVSRITNETAQAEYRSRTEGIISNESSHHLADPITGKVESSGSNGSVTLFTIEPNT